MSADTAVLADAELAAFVQKLDAWAEDLPTKERLFLKAMLEDAADTAGQDVSGFADLRGLDNEDEGGDVVGFGSFDAGDSIAGSIVSYAAALSEPEQLLFSTDD